MGSRLTALGFAVARRTLADVDARTRQWVVLGTLVLLVVLVVAGAVIR
jgi:hypothetical protein